MAWRILSPGGTREARRNKLSQVYFSTMKMPTRKLKHKIVTQKWKLLATLLYLTLNQMEMIEILKVTSSCPHGHCQPGAVLGQCVPLMWPGGTCVVL